MSIIKDIFEKIRRFMVMVFHFLDQILTPGTWLKHFGQFDQDHKPSVRAQMLFFSIVGSVLVLAAVGLALQVAAAAGAAGVVPIGGAAWMMISIVATSVADPYFQVFHSAMPVTQLLCSITFVVLFFSSLHQLPDHIASKRILQVLEHAFFGAKRAYNATKSAMKFTKQVFAA